MFEGGEKCLQRFYEKRVRFRHLDTISVSSLTNDSEIAAAVRPETNAFGALVERYQRRLYYFVVGKVADDTEAKVAVDPKFRTSS